MTSFSSLDLPPSLVAALAAMKYLKPTPIQAEAIPVILDGHDLIGCAQTGTGKTAAFALPLLARLMRSGGAGQPALVIAPTRELAEQIVQVLRELTQKIQSRDHNYKVAFVIGGTAFEAQKTALLANPSFIVGTPGRLIDHMEKGHLNLSSMGTVVIDEADRLLDMGFGLQLDRLFAALPIDRQTLLFSATIPPQIRTVATKYLRNPKSITIGVEARPVESIKQTVIRTSIEEKNTKLLEEVKKLKGSMIIFTRTKDRAEKIAKILENKGQSVARIHGDRSQTQRQEALKDLKSGAVRILVATDIAARGLDVSELQHVVNFDLPLAAEDYVHRIGRTARAGLAGHAVAFVTPEDEIQWRRIQRLIAGDRDLEPPPDPKEILKNLKRPKQKQSGPKAPQGLSGRKKPPKRKGK